MQRVADYPIGIASMTAMGRKGWVAAGPRQSERRSPTQFFAAAHHSFMGYTPSANIGMLARIEAERSSPAMTRRSAVWTEMAAVNR
jgi:hypothetical protein